VSEILRDALDNKGVKMATKLAKVEPQGGNGTGIPTEEKAKEVDVSKILTPEQLALHRAGFDVPISMKLKSALLGECGRTGENREYQIKIGNRPRTLRKIKNGRSVRFLLADVLKEQERLIRESA
jgi:hypothetical protein